MVPRIMLDNYSALAAFARGDSLDLMPGRSPSLRPMPVQLTSHTSIACPRVASRFRFAFREKAMLALSEPLDGETPEAPRTPATQVGEALPRGTVRPIVRRVLTEHPGSTVAETQRHVARIDARISPLSVGNELRRKKGKLYHQRLRRWYLKKDGEKETAGTPIKQPPPPPPSQARRTLCGPHSRIAIRVTLHPAVKLYRERQCRERSAAAGQRLGRQQPAVQSGRPPRHGGHPGVRQGLAIDQLCL
jgi:hypothetical protein